MKHYELEINAFLDNELDADEQKELFTHLSECELCRGNFNKYLLLKQESVKQIGRDINTIIGGVKIMAPIPAKDKQIKTSTKNDIFYKAAFYTSAAAAILLLFLLLNHKPEISYFAKEANRVDTVFVSKERVVYKTILKTVATKNIDPETSQKAYLSSLAKLPEKEIVFMVTPVKTGDKIL